MADDLAPIRAAIDGLVYPSERDAPFELIEWGPGLAGQPALDMVRSHTPSGKVIEEVGVDEFFELLQDSEDAARFEDLLKALAGTLQDLRIFRVGVRKVDIYLLGQTRSGAWAGVHTVSIET